MGLLLGGLATSAGAAGALPDTTTPSLSLARTIRTTPFVATNLSMRDNEGSAYVPNDPAHPNIGGTGSLWLVEDNGRAAWEVDPATGALKSSIHDTTWQATKQYDPSTDTGAGPAAGPNRDPDIESASYDNSTDTLYVFSGKCCKSSVLPTVYRLKRGVDHTFHPESYQPLAAGSDFTASDWNAADHTIYVGVGSAIRTYDYRNNVAGPTFGISGVSGIYGMGFSDDGRELYVVNSKVHLLRIDWTAKKLMTGWNIDLTPFGMKDSRSVELINDQFFIGDGYDKRASTDPLNHAVFVFDVCCGSGPPTASFTSAPLADPPFTMQLTDTSTGSPTSWAWDFDNNGTVDSTAQSPQHTFPSAGSYPVTLTATNGGGSSSITQNVVVANPPPPVAGFTDAPLTGSPHTIQFTDTSTNAPTSWAWDFDNNGTVDSTAQNPQHTFPSAGSYPVTLTVDNGYSSNSVTRSVVVSDQPTVTTLAPVADSYVSVSSPTKNYGTYTDLKILANNGTYEYHSYFQFSVSGLSGAPTSARLRLYVTRGGPTGGDWFSPSGAWSESTLNWNNAPQLAGSPFASVGATTTGQWVEIDVTSLVGGNGTFTFAATSPSTSTVTYASRETAFAPQLVITQ